LILSGAFSMRCVSLAESRLHAKKEPGTNGSRAFRIVRFAELAAKGHVRGAGPLRALRDLELDLVTLVEGAEALGFDLRVVDEDVRTTLVRQKPETLGLVEPLDGTFDHERTGLLSLVHISFATCALTNESRPPWAAPSETPEQRPMQGHHTTGRSVPASPLLGPAKLDVSLEGSRS